MIVLNISNVAAGTDQTAGTGQTALGVIFPQG